MIEEKSNCMKLSLSILVRLLAIAKRNSPAKNAGLVGVESLADLNLKDLEEEREMLNWERDDLAF